MGLFAGNRDPTAEFLPERWLDGRKGRTDLFGEGGDKLGVPHWTCGTGRRVCPGIDSKYCFPDPMRVQLTRPFSVAPTAVSTRHLYFCCISSPGSDKVLERRRRRRRRSSSFLPSVLSVSARSKWTPLADTATPTEAQAIPWSAGIMLHCCNPKGLRAWLASADR